MGPYAFHVPDRSPADRVCRKTGRISVHLVQFQMRQRGRSCTDSPCTEFAAILTNDPVGENSNRGRPVASALDRWRSGGELLPACPCIPEIAASCSPIPMQADIPDEPLAGLSRSYEDPHRRPGCGEFVTRVLCPDPVLRRIDVKQNA